MSDQCSKFHAFLMSKQYLKARRGPHSIWIAGAPGERQPGPGLASVAAVAACGPLFRERDLRGVQPSPATHAILS